MSKVLIFNDEDGCSEKVQLSECGDVYVQALHGYCNRVDDLCILEDTGNYYNITFPKNLIEDEVTVRLDYSQIDYLYKAYKAIRYFDMKKKDQVQENALLVT